MHIYALGDCFRNVWTPHVSMTNQENYCRRCFAHLDSKSFNNQRLLDAFLESFVYLAVTEVSKSSLADTLDSFSHQTWGNWITSNIVQEEQYRYDKDQREHSQNGGSAA